MTLPRPTQAEYEERRTELGDRATGHMLGETSLEDFGDDAVKIFVWLLAWDRESADDYRRFAEGRRGEL